MPENSAAGQVALHEPHDMQRMASGSMRQSSWKRPLSTLSMFIDELGDILKPKMFIYAVLLYVNVSPILPNGLLQAFQALFSGQYMLLRNKLRVLEMKLCWTHCRCS